MMILYIAGGILVALILGLAALRRWAPDEFGYMVRGLADLFRG